MLAGLENPDSGEIFINGQLINDVKPSKRGVGFVFQNYALFRYKTVFENIAFGLRINKADKGYIKDRVQELVRLVGLEGLEKRYPRQLSGGQRQRVAFARALATQPQLLLLDEPFAAIDAKVRKELRAWLREMIDEVGITSIFVTHDQEEAIELADEIILTNQGRIEQIGSPIEIYENPHTPFVAQFLGENVVIDNFRQFKGFEETGEGESALIRPEYVDVTRKNEAARYSASVEKGRIEQVTFVGNLIEVKVRLHGRLITAYRQIGQELVTVGEQVNVFIHRMYVISGDKTYTRENQIFINNESVVI
jgi:sulfate transport system ATP-binding protein